MQTDHFLELRNNGYQQFFATRAELSEHIANLEIRGGLKPDARLYEVERRAVSLEGE